MKRRAPLHLLAAIAAIGAILGGPGGTARAGEPSAADLHGGFTDTLRRSGWQLGAWPSTAAGDRGDDDTLNAMRPKVRGAGGWNIPLRMVDELTVRPWARDDRRLDGGRSVSSGLLMDVSLGAFTFTPSVAASFGGAPLGAAVDSDTAPRLRSQFEVGYQFGDASRVVFGYSRVTTIGARDEGGEDHEVISLSYRLPFGSLLDW